MSKPIIKAEINENIPIIGVNVPDGNVPVLPVETVGDTPIEPVLLSLAATENGEYLPDTGIDGFNRVLVNVEPHLTNLVATENGTYRPESPFEGYGAVVVNIDTSKPDEVELVNFDFTTNTLYDSIRGWTIPNQNYTNVTTSNNGIVLTQSNSLCNLAFIPTTNSFFEIKIKYGTNTAQTVNNYNALFKFNKSDAHQTLTYCKGVQIDDNPEGTWRLNDQSGGIVYLTVGYGNPYYFDNKELIIEYGYYYDNGVFTPNYNRFSYKINNEYIHIGVNNFIINPNGEPQLVLGGGATMVGTVIEKVKVKQLFKWNLTREIINDEEVR